MKEIDLKNDIKDLKEKLEIERTVTDKIQDFIKKKQAIIAAKSEKRDKLRESECEKLMNERNITLAKKDETD